MGSLKRAASCSFSPSSSIFLEVVEKRDKGKLFERMLVHNLRVYTAGGEVAVSSAAWDRLWQCCVCQARPHQELKDRPRADTGECCSVQRHFTGFMISLAPVSTQCTSWWEMEQIRVFAHQGVHGQAFQRTYTESSPAPW